MMQARVLTGDLAGPAQSRGAEARDARAAAADRSTRDRALARRGSARFLWARRGSCSLTGGALWWRRRAGGVSVTYLEGPSVRASRPARPCSRSAAASAFPMSRSAAEGRAARPAACASSSIRAFACARRGRGAHAARHRRDARHSPRLPMAPDRRDRWWRASCNRSPARLVASERDADDQGVDTEAAVLFVDIRGFTALSEHKFAYDVVHILNRFFAAATLRGPGRGRPDRQIHRGRVDGRSSSIRAASISLVARRSRALRRSGASLRPSIAISRRSSRSRCASPWACMPGASCAAGSVPGARRRGP